MQKLITRITQQLVGHMSHQFACLFICVMTFMGFASPAYAALNTTISSTANLSYAGLATAIPATVDIYATINTANNATLTVTTVPTVSLGSTSNVTIQLNNTGINDLYSGMVTVTPPTGTTMLIPVDPYGLYVATAQPDNSWQVTIPDLVTGASFTVPSSLNVPASGVVGNATVTAAYTANGVSIVQNAGIVNVVNTRTPAQISFLHLNSVLNAYEVADVYHAGQTIYVQVKDGDQNVDPYTKQSVTVTLKDSISGDTESFVLTETGLDTGVFIGSIPSTRTNLIVPGDSTLSVSAESEITASYKDAFDNTDTAASAALVDPFGVIFDTANGLPIDGVTITVINTVTNAPAAVVGDDGVSAYPSTLVSGGSATDASGTVYNFGPGKYRFPFMNPGNYRLELTPPPGYAYPSQVSNAVIQALPNAPFSIVQGSKGEVFTISAGPALHIDIPLDSQGANLFVRKTTATPIVAIGDRAAYKINVENVHPLSPANTTVVQDTLPLGFRYQAGSAQLDGVSIAEPTIQADGRNISFNLGTIAAASSVNLSYIAVVGSNTKPGQAVNSATASGVMGTSTVVSNVSNAIVTVHEALVTSVGFIAGTVFIDEDMNDIQDEGELGVQGIRIYMEDGRSVITDEEGQYHFDYIRTGRHVLQMDKTTIQQRYEARGLKNTRFANNDFSQFVEVTGGGLARSNFRLIHRAPDETPVTINHTLQDEQGLVWATVDVVRGNDVELSELKGFYALPTGWKYVEGSATVDDVYSAPELSPVGLIWELKPELSSQRIRLAMRGGGDSGLKQASAYARFVSPGSENGRTGVASINIQDHLEELREQREFTAHLKFATRKASLPEQEEIKLTTLLNALNGLVVRDLIVEGHTDSVPIALNHREEFADNTALSQARADYIANYFQEKLQLEEGIVKAIGKGEKEPIASNHTSKGRELNRRVVLKVRADQITHDYYSELQDNKALAEGVALDSWAEKTVEVSAQKKEEKPEGILSPVNGMSLPHPVASVRVALDSRLTARLELDGQEVSNERIGFKSVDRDTGKTIYTYIGVDMGAPGQHQLTLKGIGPFGRARFEESIAVDRTGSVAKIKFIESGENIADGKTPVRFRLALTDNTGTRINGSMELSQLGGDLLVTAKNEQSILTEETSKRVFVDADGWVNLAPTTDSGSHRIVLGYNNIEETVEVYVKPETRDWILVGFGEGTLGHNKLSGAVQPITDPTESDKFYQDGRVAFYAKGQVSGGFLLTLAYDTANKSAAEQSSRFGDIDPNSMYTVYGDNTQQQFDATSKEKLYIKLERDTFYALFGDYNTNLTTTELTRYSRTFTGVKAELHEDAIGFSAFATQTSQTLVRDDIRGNGTSGLYRLSRQNIISNTEVIRIETMDRFKSELVLSSIQLTRHIDYDIDYVLGTIWFKQPVLSQSTNFNPIMIRVEYEADDATDQFTTAGGRVYVKPHENIEMGGTFVSEGHLGGSNTLSGADVKVQLGDNIDVIAEVAESVNDQVGAQAWKVEARMTDEEISGRAYARQQDDNFGLGQQQTSENSTLKVGVDAQYRLGEDESLNGEVFRQEVTNTGASRDMASLQYNKHIDDYDLRAGVRRNVDQDGVGTVTSSSLGSIGATSRVTNRLSMRADHEQALSSNNGIDFPTRSSIGADYLITETTSLVATQEWTRGQTQDTTSTRVGVNTQPWNGAQMTTSYEQQLGEDGKRSFANAGLLQTWDITEALSFSAGLDKSKVLTKKTPVQLNLNAPVATGGEDFTAYSVGANFHPESWTWSNRYEYRVSDLSKHHGVSIGVQGSPLDSLSAQWTMQWQKDALSSGSMILQSDSSLRAAWRPSYDQLILLNRFDIRRSEQLGLGTDTKSLRYINNMTANWQSDAAWQLRVNHGIKLSKESIDTSSWSGISDLAGLQLTYDYNEDWDVTVQALALRVRDLGDKQQSVGLAVGYNMFDNFWLGLGYNVVGFYDQDFAAAEYSRAGTYFRFRFKYDQDSLKDMLN